MQDSRINLHISNEKMWERFKKKLKKRDAQIGKTVTLLVSGYLKKPTEFKRINTKFSKTRKKILVDRKAWQGFTKHCEIHHGGNTSPLLNRLINEWVRNG